MSTRIDFSPTTSLPPVPSTTRVVIVVLLAYAVSAMAGDGSAASHATVAGSGGPGLPTSVGGGGPTCPRACFCNSPSRIVYCSRRGLAAIPDGVAADTLQLNLNGNAFQSTTVVRSNMSHYGRLEHLYLSECQLEHIEVGAFGDLRALLWLDLSNNRLTAIRPDTFDGLRLQQLFLNGNRNIQVLSAYTGRI